MSINEKNAKTTHDILYLHLIVLMSCFSFVFFSVWQERSDPRLFFFDLSLSFALKSDLSLTVSIWSTRKPMALIKKVRKAVSISFCYQVSSFFTDVVKMALNVRL